MARTTKKSEIPAEVQSLVKLLQGEKVSEKRLRNAEQVLNEKLGRGRIEDLDKHLLKVDHSYQRAVSDQRAVQWIADHFLWAACQVLVVARRPDDSYWIVDGQYRWNAVLLKPDIQTLTCRVFDIDDLPTESLLFIVLNARRKNPSACTLHPAQVQVQDTVSLKIEKLAEKHNFFVGDLKLLRLRGNTSRQRVSCVKAVRDMLLQNEKTASRAFETCARICKDRPFDEALFRGLCRIQDFWKTHEAEVNVNDSMIIDGFLKLGAGNLIELMRSLRTNQRDRDDEMANALVTLLNRKCNFELPCPKARQSFRVAA